jgi:hypothetical protein
MVRYYRGFREHRAHPYYMGYFRSFLPPRLSSSTESACTSPYWVLLLLHGLLDRLCAHSTSLPSDDLHALCWTAIVSFNSLSGTDMPIVDSMLLGIVTILRCFRLDCQQGVPKTLTQRHCFCLYPLLLLSYASLSKDLSAKRMPLRALWGVRIAETFEVVYYRVAIGEIRWLRDRSCSSAFVPPRVCTPIPNQSIKLNRVPEGPRVSPVAGNTSVLS